MQNTANQKREQTVQKKNPVMDSKEMARKRRESEITAMYLSYDEAMKRGDSLLKKNNLAEATKTFDSALRDLVKSNFDFSPTEQQHHDAKRLTVFLKLYHIKFKQNRLTDCLDLCAQFLKSNPFHIEVLLKRVSVYVVQKNYVGALGDIHTVKTLEPSNQVALKQHAKIKVAIEDEARKKTNEECERVKVEMENEARKRTNEDLQKLVALREKQRATLQEELSEHSESHLGLCCICMDKTIDIALVPCGHLTVCSFCVQFDPKTRSSKGGISKCPICRVDLHRVLKVFFS